MLRFNAHLTRSYAQMRLNVIKNSYLAVPAPLVISVLMRSSCPYRAAMCRGVFPFLSLQSISAPTHIEKHTTVLDTVTVCLTNMIAAKMKTHRSE